MNQKNYEYDFVTVAVDAGKYIIADQKGGSYYLPRQISQSLPEKGLKIGDILHIIAENKLEMTELAGTNSIICQGTVRSTVIGSLLMQGRTADFLISNTAYGSVLLTDSRTGKDYAIFTSYVTEGWRTPSVEWSAVTEGNLVRFLLFGDMPVMPVPKKRHIYRLCRKNRKTPAMRSFLNDTYGASSGASMISISSSSASGISGSTVSS